MKLCDEQRKKLLDENGIAANEACDAIVQMEHKNVRSRNPIKSPKCYCCESHYCLADHHIQPRESGGSNEERNLVTLWVTCHDAVEGQREGLSSGDIWLNVLKRKESFQLESPRRKRYRLSRDNAQPCPVYVPPDERRRRIEENRKAVLNTLNIQDYFAQPDTPETNSPVGKVMVNVLAKNPGLDLEAARAEASRLLDRATDRKKYSMPRVLSAEQQLAEKARRKEIPIYRVGGTPVTAVFQAIPMLPATHAVSEAARASILERPPRVHSLERTPPQESHLGKITAVCGSVAKTIKLCSLKQPESRRRVGQAKSKHTRFTLYRSLGSMFYT